MGEQGLEVNTRTWNMMLEVRVSLSRDDGGVELELRDESCVPFPLRREES